MSDVSNALPRAGCPPRVGVYSVRCRATGRAYVGCSDHLSRDVAAHLAQLASQVHPNLDMQSDWDAHGGDDFEFVIHDEIPAEPYDAALAAELDALRDLWVDLLGVDEGRTY